MFGNSLWRSDLHNCHPHFVPCSGECVLHLRTVACGHPVNTDDALTFAHATGLCAAAHKGAGDLDVDVTNTDAPLCILPHNELTLNARNVALTDRRSVHRVATIFAEETFVVLVPSAATADADVPL